ncbi:transglutaminase-like domain-containing protein [Flavobacterium sp. 5]|uniref:transglutaminase-like domain-containing protein n=1 Tax=Flavobacterium sp. 5 TaxID=2035199 RepID=UPI000C2B84DE|nr:transglutaminase-like domain-containing protein [Flavobacterium sp. 5]PKB18372.1 hypothetical protein CLU82_3647 [Flavobacterium sp. 5]
MAKNEKALTKEQINQALRRQIQDGVKFDSLIDKPANERTKLETANTFYSVAMIKKYVELFFKQVSRLAPHLQGKTLEETCKNIHSFLWNHVQYQIDYVTQHIRSPANIWANRQSGVECKNFSLFASAILTNLGIKHYIRQIKNANFKPKQFTHVYIVVPKNQLTGDLKDGHFVIDGTSRYNRETSIKEKKDVFMSDNLPHLGLNGAPKKRASKKPTAKQLAARKKFSQMAKDGTLAKKRKSATKKSGLNAPAKSAKKTAPRTKKQFPFN